jgi:uncharacterized protein with HEPN domain
MPREGLGGRDREMPDDLIRLRHMLDAARDARRYVEGRSREDLDTDSMLLRAVVHALQVIGEAAARTTDPGRNLAPELPWPKMVGMRHILVHVYFDIDADAVWKVVTAELPLLITALERVIDDH